MGQISFSPSRTDTERAAMVSRRGTGHGGPQSLPASDVFGISCPGGGRGRPRQRERTARVHVRAAVRTNGGRRRQLQALGHPASRQIHPCAERRRKAASEARFIPMTSLIGLNQCPCAVTFQTACGVLAWLAGGRGSGLFAKRSARSLGGNGQREDRLALWPN